MAKKKYNKSLSGKFLIAILLAAATIVASWLFTKTAFQKMLGTVSQLSQPNPKLRLVNSIFRDLVQLDQLQREQALQTYRRTYNPFLKESHEIKRQLDSLQILSSGNETHIRQIDSMKRLLDERDKVFLNYLSLRKDFISNDTITRQIRMLSEMIGQASMSIDSSVVTTEKKIVTTTIQDIASEEKNTKPSFWDKLIGRKKETAKAQKLIQEELNIKIDTVAKANEDSMVQKLSDAIANKENDRMQQRNKLVNRQMQLNRSGGLLINRVLGMLQQLEDEELLLANRNISDATNLVNTGINRMTVILLLFIMGSVLLGFLFFGDIAKSNQYRKELIAAKEEAEQLESVKHRFLANMSHELRTPLQAIVGLAEQSKLKGDMDKHDMDTIFHSSRHLLQTVNEVLDYSRIVSGKFNIENAPFDMDKTLQETIHIISAKATEKNLHFNIHIEHSYGMYMGDAFRLKQVLFNLLGNAIKFTESGSISLMITTKEFGNRTAFHFAIKDTGVGISEEDRMRIFNQFEQGNISHLQNHEGTGLGLSIVKSLVELQKGTLSVESTPGKGSEFIVSLSYAHAPVDELQDETNLVLQKSSVWFIDDDTVILNLCSSIMSKYHLPHRTFSSALEVMRTPIDEQVKTFFIDIRMPEMNGLELCSHLRKKTANDVNIIALTAQALEEDREIILQSGFNNVLIKPFLEKELLAFLSMPGVAQPMDISSLEKMTGHNKELMISIAQSFETETQKDAALLKKGIADMDITMITEPLHKLAGRFSQMGIKELAERMRGFELDLREQKQYDPQYSQALFSLVDDLLSVSRSFTSQVLSKLKTAATDC